MIDAVKSAYDHRMLFQFLAVAFMKILCVIQRVQHKYPTKENNEA